MDGTEVSSSQLTLGCDNWTKPKQYSELQGFSFLLKIGKIRGLTVFVLSSVNRQELREYSLEKAPRFDLLVTPMPWVRTPGSLLGVHARASPWAVQPGAP